MELCQIHFGATIVLPTDGLLSYGQSKFNRSAYAIGTITYLDGVVGTLIYLKPAVTNRSSVIVKSFDRDSPAFPHEPTANQWFDETQFEAYRLLGRETAIECFDHYSKPRTKPTPSLTTGYGRASLRPSPSNPPPLNSPSSGNQAPVWWKGDTASWRNHLQDVDNILWPKGQN
jgi:hypothetical protein